MNKEVKIETLKVGEKYDIKFNSFKYARTLYVRYFNPYTLIDNNDNIWRFRSSRGCDLFINKGVAKVFIFKKANEGEVLRKNAPESWYNEKEKDVLEFCDYVNSKFSPHRTQVSLVHKGHKDYFDKYGYREEDVFGDGFLLGKDKQERILFLAQRVRCDGGSKENTHFQKDTDKLKELLKKLCEE